MGEQFFQEDDRRRGETSDLLSGLNIPAGPKNITPPALSLDEAPEGVELIDQSSILRLPR